MAEISVEKISVNDKIVSADITVNGEVTNVWYEFPEVIDETAIKPANAFMVIALPVAMRMGKSLTVKGAVSERLINQLEEYQTIMKKWYPYLNKVDIKAEKIEEDLKIKQEQKTICCFTGGVDAFYSTLKNLNRIDDLLYVWGFDIPLTEEKFYNKVKENLTDAAGKLNKNLVLVKTNVGYEFTNKYVSWGDMCYGAAIASVVLLMENKYAKSIIPSCNDYSTLCPRGSHLLINHLWNCDGLSFEYDGAESSRVEKVDFIADYDVVSKYLRVCYRSNEKYNCCKCEKCLRTMASLEAVGKLQKIDSFNKSINYEDFSDIDLENESEYKMAIDTMNYAIKNNKTELAVNLEKQIKNYEIKKITDYLENHFIDYINSDISGDINYKIYNHILSHDTVNSLKRILKTAFKKTARKK